MTTFRDDRRFGEHETFRRDPGPDFNDEARAAQIARFLAGGGRIEVIPSGTMQEYKPTNLRPDRERQSRGGKKGSQERRGKPGKREIPEINREEIV